MENQKNDKKRFLAMVILLACLIVIIAAWGMFDYLNNGQKSGLGVLVIALIVAAFGFRFIKIKYNSLKQGEPLKDERSRKLETKAGAYAFYIGIYWLLGLSLAIDFFHLSIPADSVPSIGIAGMAIIFGLAYWHLNRKGE
ncbi:MAG: DUF2178 domain-containing protein [Patescibacteria group bacterium]|nr:DUF2178 domain-containing protein [Patescibacteria group bacterium]